MEDDDDDSPQLSEQAMAALQEFYGAKQSAELDLLSDNVIGEDWQLSQFWYDDHTAKVLAEECIRESGVNGCIVCISCPTVFKKLMELNPPDCNFMLLEYDQRFSVYENKFVYYDYKRPLDLPDELKGHSFDVVVADPPFLSEECLQKFTQTINFLRKDKVLLCTGSTMSDSAEKLLGVKKCSFIPKHSRNLANDFCCFVNFESKLLNYNIVD